MSEPSISFEDTRTAFEYKSYKELKHAYSLFRLLSKNSLVNIGTSLTQMAMKFHLPIKPFVKPIIYRQFCAGETFAEGIGVFDMLAKYGVDSMINYGLEAKENEETFDKALKENLKDIEYAKVHDHVNIIAVKVTGFGSLSILEKKQAGHQLTASEQQAFDRMIKRMDLLAEQAINSGVQLYYDAEESWIQDELDTMVEDMMRQYNKQKPVIYQTFQHYRHDRLDYLQEMIEKSGAENYVLGAKLVRGAYVDKENERATEMGYPSPLHSNKAAVDKDYDEAIDLCLKHLNNVAFCVASHNEKSNMHLAEQVTQLNLPKNHPYIVCSQLYGMGDHITFNMARHGYNAVKYIPYGPVKEVIPYLIRRAKENMSVEGQMSRELQLLDKEMRRRRQDA